MPGRSKRGRRAMPEGCAWPRTTSVRAFRRLCQDAVPRAVGSEPDPVPFRSVEPGSGRALRSALARVAAGTRSPALQGRSWMKSIACAVLFSANVLSAPALAAPDAPQQTPDTYAVAGERITIAPGRALNLRCSGEGPQTVLLEAGGNADSATWFRAQSLLAPQARVCAYDRAGYEIGRASCRERVEISVAGGALKEKGGQRGRGATRL